jgi:flagellar biosynthetic protein FliQ
MTQEAVLNIANETLWTVIIAAAPLLLLSLLVGLLVSVFQTVTSIQEQTLTFIPKILSIFFGLMIFGSFILTKIVNLMETLWNSFGEYIG